VKVLLVDVRETIAKGLMSNDMEVKIGLQQPWTFQPDVVVTSRNIDVVRAARRRYGECPIIVYSQKYDMQEVRFLFSLGIEDYLQDPTFTQIVRAIEHTQHRRNSGTKRIHQSLHRLTEYIKQARLQSCL
jgi:DNA-binding NarL/FixJ family response regulator